MPVSEPRHLFFFDTSHNATNHGPGAPIFEGKVRLSRRPSVRLDRWLAPIDRGFRYASNDNLFGGVSRAAVSIYLFYRARGGGGLTGGNRQKFLNTSAAARWTPSPGVPFDGVFYCASFDTSFDGISRSVLSIYSFFTPRWRGIQQQLAYRPLPNNDTLTFLLLLPGYHPPLGNEASEGE